MDGHRFDHLTRRVGSRLSRRAGLGLLAVVGTIGRDSSSSIAGKKKGKKGKGKKEKISICHQGQALKVKKKGWQGRYPGATQGSCQVSSDVCASCLNSCFATSAQPDIEPTEFACCPAELTCISRSSLPDQCCYPDESCRPDLHQTFGNIVETNCCRACNGLGSLGGCCVSQSEECIDGDCKQPGTARLPRKRRL